MNEEQHESFINASQSFLCLKQLCEGWVPYELFSLQLKFSWMGFLLWDCQTLLALARNSSRPAYPQRKSKSCRDNRKYMYRPSGKLPKYVFLLDSEKCTIEVMNLHFSA
jgi:hypothetical protein